MSHLSGYHLLPTDKELSDWYIPSGSSSVDFGEYMSAEEWNDRFRPYIHQSTASKRYCDVVSDARAEEAIARLRDQMAESRYRADQIKKRERVDWRGPADSSIRPKRYRPRTLKYSKSRK